jgi:hypothetical protein
MKTHDPQHHILTKARIKSLVFISETEGGAGMRVFQYLSIAGKTNESVLWAARVYILSLQSNAGRLVSAPDAGGSLARRRGMPHAIVVSITMSMHSNTAATSLLWRFSSKLWL